MRRGQAKPFKRIIPGSRRGVTGDLESFGKDRQIERESQRDSVARSSRLAGNAHFLAAFSTASISASEGARHTRNWSLLTETR